MYDQFLELERYKGMAFVEVLEKVPLQRSQEMEHASHEIIKYIILPSRWLDHVGRMPV